MALLEVDDIAVRFGGIIALADLSFDVDDGQICGLIGPNGAGKTTLFNVISRIYDPTTGRITFDGANLLDLASHQISAAGVYRTFQNLALWPRMSVLENVMTGAHTRARQSFLTAMLDIGRRREERALKEQAWEMLTSLGLERVAFQACAGLPYGTLKRIELARAVIGRPKLLMLDEPATGLTHSEVEELREVILELRRRYDLTILLVEHNMGLVMKMSEKVVVLDFGRKIAEGTPTEVRANTAVIEAYLGVPDDAA